MISVKFLNPIWRVTSSVVFGILCTSRRAVNFLWKRRDGKETIFVIIDMTRRHPQRTKDEWNTATKEIEQCQQHLIFLFTRIFIEFKWRWEAAFELYYTFSRPRFRYNNEKCWNSICGINEISLSTPSASSNEDNCPRLCAYPVIHSTAKSSDYDRQNCEFVHLTGLRQRTYYFFIGVTFSNEISNENVELEADESEMCDRQWLWRIMIFFSYLLDFLPLQMAFNFFLICSH